MQTVYAGEVAHKSQVFWESHWKNIFLSLTACSQFVKLCSGSLNKVLNLGHANDHIFVSHECKEGSITEDVT